MNEEKQAKSEPIIGENLGFDRIRRITGYLVSSTSRWNSAKLAELNDRVKHDTKAPMQ